ncbi:MAG: S-methyl-5-thioribose-1-phosphate isomerase [Trizodia sp. TS-e1964]|nr:MAG: S-methyl-5-thioribose-1-phosphate isomerase [Trizodia sp. TS-e1964]
MTLSALQYRPLSPEAGARLSILNQLLLPHESVFIPIQNSAEAHHAIKTMQVRGAPLIALVAILALAVELSSNSYNQASADDARKLINERLDYLLTSRPTAVNLADAATKLKGVLAATHGESAEDVVAAYVRKAELMWRCDEGENRAIGDCGLKWLVKDISEGQRINVLTHCNTGLFGVAQLTIIRSLATAGYGTALGVIRSLHSQGRLGHAYYTETRPYNQGARLTSFELAHDGIPSTMTTDSMAGALLSGKKPGVTIAAVIVGADRVAANGDTANKIGTYSLAVLARYHGVRFVVAAPRTTIDLSTAHGDHIVVEERPADEVRIVKGLKLSEEEQISKELVQVEVATKGINVWNPAFDVTPAELIDAVVTEVGVVERSPDGRFHFEEVMLKKL